MCLGEKLTKEEFEKRYCALEVEDGVRIAWKIFKKTSNGRLVPQYRIWSGLDKIPPLRIGEWLINTLKMRIGLFSFCKPYSRNKYISGFHAYPRRKDAVRMAMRPNCEIRKIGVRGRLTYGIQNHSPVVVTQEMYIDRAIPRTKEVD